MEEKIALGIAAAVMGFALGFHLGEEHGWWTCFRAFERARKSHPKKEEVG